MQGFSLFEGGFLMFLQEYIRNPWLDTFFTTITKLGNAGWFWIALGVLLLISRKHRKEGMAVLLSLLIGFMITNVLLKNLIARPRPYTIIEGLNILISEPSDYSFPSGHTCSSVAAALALLQMSDRKTGIAACILAFLIAFSRLYVGVHFPSDVIVGAIIGALSAWISVMIIEKRKNIERKY